MRLLRKSQKLKKSQKCKISKVSKVLLRFLVLLFIIVVIEVRIKGSLGILPSSLTEGYYDNVPLLRTTSTTLPPESLSPLPPPFCNHSLACSLNGCIDDSGVCECRPPWSGENCDVLLTKPSKASGKNLFPTRDERNSWSGPVHYDEATNQYHMWLAVYAPGNLAKPNQLYHGISTDVAGPYQWTLLDNKNNAVGPNPGFVAFPATTDSGKQVENYALFVNQQIYIDTQLMPHVNYYANNASSHYQFNNSIAPYPHINFSPIYHNNSFYGTYQATARIYKWTNLSHPVELHGTIEVGNPRLRYPKTDERNKTTWHNHQLEDPYLWIDEYDHWHIIGHAFDKGEERGCSTSLVSSHLYSIDGTKWHKSPNPPYAPTIHYDDATKITYSTLERPYVVLDKNSKRPTHIVLAAPFHFGDEGCWNTTQCAKNKRACSCVNCKWLGQTGTVVLTLQTSDENKKKKN